MSVRKSSASSTMTKTDATDSLIATRSVIDRLEHHILTKNWKQFKMTKQTVNFLEPFPTLRNQVNMCFEKIRAQFGEPYTKKRNQLTPRRVLVIVELSIPSTAKKDAAHMIMIKLSEISNVSNENLSLLHVVFSSPEPKAQGEPIVYRSSRRLSVCLSVCGHFQTRISQQPVGQS